ncbi:transglutaminase TgpA family protein [Arthrobacter sp. HLT1-20]
MSRVESGRATPGHDAGQTGPSAPAPRRLGTPQTGPARWVLAFAVFAAVMGTSLSLRGLVVDFSWFPPAALVVACTLFFPALLRRYLPLSPFAPVGALLGWFLGLTLVFFPGTALLGFLPTPATVGAALELASRASTLIMTNTAPVPSAPAIFFLICAGLGFAALLIDTVAITVAMPAASALGLVLIMLPAALTTRAGVGTLGFVAAGAGFLLVLGCCNWYAPEGKIRSGSIVQPTGILSRAMALGAAVMLLTALLPAAIPGFTQGSFPQGSRLNGPSGVSELDPMISLGANLRQQSNQVALSYLSNTSSAQYLRLSTLEDFTGKTWQPAPVDRSLPPGLTQLAPAPSAADSVPSTETLTVLSTPSLASEWLPAPLSATEVTGLNGSWLWDPARQTIRSSTSSTAGQRYTVRSKTPQLTRSVLATATAAPRPELDPIFTSLPPNVPAIVGTTARNVAGQQPTPYAQAVALQDYLRSGAFTYSLDTPVQDGYDGSGMDVLAKFLDVKSGYCIHFSAAMAVMARELGIPSRIAVGYAPGSSTSARGELEGQALNGFQATGRDAHAWTELYFQGLGWVPFEPTPSRGLVPDYTRDTTAATPQASAGPTAATSADPTSTDTATATATAAVAGGASSGSNRGTLVTGVSVAVLLLLATPALARMLVRRRRLGQVGGSRGSGLGIGGLDGRGAALVAWRELVATAVDYGYDYDPALTPARHAERISRLLGRSNPAGLALVLRSYEQAAYGKAGSSAEPGNEELAAALQTLIVRLKTAATPWQRLRATLLPPSFLTRP